MGEFVHYDDAVDFEQRVQSGGDRVLEFRLKRIGVEIVIKAGM